MTRLGAVLLGAVLVAPALPAQARPSYPSDGNKPPVTALLVGFRTLWTSSGANDRTGVVLDAAQLEWNDQVTSWVNQHATPAQQFRALQNSKYLSADGSGYDQSITIADGLGERLGALYAKGRIDGSLPLTTQLVNTSNGTVGAYLDSGGAKNEFSYPRPYLSTNADSAPVPGDSDECAPSLVNAQSLAAVRVGKPWTTSSGDLQITRVAGTVDTTRAFASKDVGLDASYGQPGLCLAGSFPSSHVGAVYAAGITLATLLPELAPSILARASEAANNRIVLGVHYPLDVIGGRIAGEAAAAARWSDERFRNEVLAPARKELVTYLQKACGGTLQACVAADHAYSNDPYAGQAPPMSSSQVVTDRSTAMIAYTERLSYGFPDKTPAGLGPEVPAGAENLLRMAFPTLTSAQRRGVLAQTQAPSGNALDTTSQQLPGTADGSWQRLNLAAALSATVLRMPDGSVVVLTVGDQPSVIDV